MESARNVRDKIKVADVVVSTNHVTFLTNGFLRLITLPKSAIFVSGTSGITAILKYRSVNPIYYYYSLQAFPLCGGYSQYILSPTDKVFEIFIFDKQE